MVLNNKMEKVPLKMPLKIILTTWVIITILLKMMMVLELVLNHIRENQINKTKGKECSLHIIKEQLQEGKIIKMIMVTKMKKKSNQQS